MNSEALSRESAAKGGSLALNNANLYTFNKDSQPISSKQQDQYTYDSPVLQSPYQSSPHLLNKDVDENTMKKIQEAQ